MMNANRPVTLFTGQWVDLPLESLAKKVQTWGYDGLELACDGDHFDVDRALSDKEYLLAKRALLDKYQLQCHAINISLVGQCVADKLIDSRHKRVIPARVWGDGDPEGVRQRAAQEVMNAARAAAEFGIDRVIGFTGSPIWHMLYSFPPNDWQEIEAGYREVVDRWNPILDVFDEVGVRFCLEVHPTEIAYDIYTTQRTLECFNHRPTFGINFDPSHLIHQFVDPTVFIEMFADRIYHVHIKESIRRLDGRSSILGSHLNFGDPRRGWDFITAGYGGVNWSEIFRVLNRVGYDGPLSVEWEDNGMEREYGAREALALARRFNFPAGTRSFDSAFGK
jgi:sugar phosphate isomerase/epimerase